MLSVISQLQVKYRKKVCCRDLRGFRSQSHEIYIYISGQLVSVLHQLQSTEVLLGVQTEPSVFQFVCITSCPGTGHHWNEFGSIFFAPFPQVFIDIDKILSEPSLIRVEPPPLSFSSWERCSRPFVILMAIHQNLFSMSISLVPERSELNTVFQVWPQKCWGEGSFPLTCWQWFSQCSTGYH